MTASKVYVPIMGFTQDTSRVTGIEKIWRDLRLRSSAETWVLPPQVWDADWVALANLIRNNARQDAEIVVVAYSWGAGHGFVQLARQLNQHGLHIKIAILADPVYRSPRPSMRWRSLINRGPLAPKIKVPWNVHQVFWTRQFKNKPRGHQLVREMSGQLIHQPIEVDCEHAYMDDRHEFRDLVMEVVNG